MKKREATVLFSRQNPGLLACPLCNEPMQATDYYAFLCATQHSFDVSSSGYINLLTKPVKSEYGAELLESRNKVCKLDFFDGLLNEIRNIIAEHSGVGIPAHITMLDAGCGEGSHLQRVIEQLKANNNRTVTGVGVDISKEGIRIAAREYPGILWLVADLANLPLSSRQFDVILNILSPSNYGEFGRVLKPGGLLIKAVPGSGYLRELRQALYDDARQEYSGDERVLNHFADCFTVLDSRQVRYTVSMEGEGLKNLIAMTPLAWQATQERINKVLEIGAMEITVDFTVVTGVKEQDRQEYAQ